MNRLNLQVYILSLTLLYLPALLPAATLHIQVRDEAGQAIWARLEVRGANDKEYQPKTSIRDLTAKHHRALPYYLGSFVIQGACDVNVPPGRYRVIVEHGLEYTRVEKSVTVAAEGVTQVELPLRPWIRMWQRGWWSGDFHLHRPLADTQKLILAEDLNFCPVITQWPHRKDMQALTDDVWGARGSGQIAVDARHLITLRNAEDERGGGAWIFLSLPRLIEGLDTAAWFTPSGLDFIRQARAQRSSADSLPGWTARTPSGGKFRWPWPSRRPIRLRCWATTSCSMVWTTSPTGDARPASMWRMIAGPGCTTRSASIIVI